MVLRVFPKFMIYCSLASLSFKSPCSSKSIGNFMFIWCFNLYIDKIELSPRLVPRLDSSGNSKIVVLQFMLLASTLLNCSCSISCYELSGYSLLWTGTIWVPCWLSCRIRIFLAISDSYVIRPDESLFKMFVLADTVWNLGKFLLSTNLLSDFPPFFFDAPYS